MTTPSAQLDTADAGLITLVTLLRFHGIGADPEQLRHRLGTASIGIPEMLRGAKELGLKARKACAAAPRRRAACGPVLLSLSCHVVD